MVQAVQAVVEVVEETSNLAINVTSVDPNYNTSMLLPMYMVLRVVHSVRNLIRDMAVQGDTAMVLINTSSSNSNTSNSICINSNRVISDIIIKETPEVKCKRIILV